MAGEGKGWISLYRSIQDHWLWQEEEYTKLQAWLDLLLSANHKEGKTLIGNKLVTVEVGCRVTSIKKLMKRWGWGNTRVRNFLNLLQEENMIKYSGEKYTLIEILNYEKYQKQTDRNPVIPRDSASKQIDNKSTVNQEQTDSKSTVTREQIDNKSITNTNNNDNNNNNNNNENKENKEQPKNSLPPLKSIILNSFGKLTFKTWFEPCDIQDTKEKLIIYAPNTFTKEVIETRFKIKLEALFKKVLECKTKGE